MEVNDKNVQSRYWVAKCSIEIASNVHASSVVIRLYHFEDKVIGGDVAFAFSNEILRIARQDIEEILGIPEIIWDHLKKALEREPNEYLLLNYSINEPSTGLFQNLMRVASREEFKEWLETNANRLLNLKHLSWQHAKVEKLSEIEN